MKKMLLRPFYNMVKPQIRFIDGDEDDFDLSGIKGGGSKKENEEGDEEEGDENSEENEKSDATEEENEEGKKESSEDESGEGEEDDDKSGKEEDDNEGKGDDDGKEKSKDGDGGKEKKESESGDDFFSDLNAAEDSKNDDDYTPLATDLGIELQNPKDRKEFIEKVNNQIKEAQQKFDLSGYNETSQRLIKYANENGNLVDFFANPKITQLNSFLVSTPEMKYSQVREGQLAKDGLDAESIEEKITEEIDEMSTRELKDKVSKFDDEVKKALNNEIVSILGDKETQIAEAKSKAESEIENEKQSLIKYVEGQTDFLGLPLTEANKKGIINSIKNGTFDVVVEQNQAASKFNAFMFNKFYDKFVQQIEDSTKEASRSGYVKGVRKGQGTAYNKKPAESGAKGTEGVKERWKDLSDLE